MLVMPANSTGWFWHCLARETGRIGHLYSPGAQRGPWPWFPFALDNRCFVFWNQDNNTFDDNAWNSHGESDWKSLIAWAAPTGLARWAIVPDVPGNAARTLERWHKYYAYVRDSEITPAMAVQDGMTVESVKSLRMQPAVICVGGTTDWKWSTVEMWAKKFPRVHVLRCNSPEKLHYLEALGVESCDGTGWNRGDRRQTEGVEEWARLKPEPRIYSLAPYTCRKARGGQAELFAV
jgi:hypothetical protein